MKYYIPQHSKQSLGGGWTFIRNFESGMKALDWERTSDPNNCDVILIAGATMTERAEIEVAKAKGIPIIFRVDNIPKDSRNRGTAISRMKDFGRLADVVIFQSEWARAYAKPLVGEGTVVYNGVDLNIFHANQEKRSADVTRYLFVQYNRDENKRFPEAAYYFHNIAKTKPAELWLVGNYSPEIVSYNFDFWNGEDIQYIPTVEDPKAMATIMQSCNVLLFPAFADAAPNTVLEARGCGMEVALVNSVGGTQEMLNPVLDISLHRMCLEYAGIFSVAIQSKTL